MIKLDDYKLLDEAGCFYLKDKRPVSDFHRFGCVLGYWEIVSGNGTWYEDLIGVKFFGYTSRTRHMERLYREHRGLEITCLYDDVYPYYIVGKNYYVHGRSLSIKNLILI